MTLRICSIVALIQTAGFIATAQTPIPGKYYEYYTVARTGAGFTDLGSGGGPSINDVGEVGFRGATANGNGLWFGTGAAAPINFNPGESFASSDIIQPSVQINANHQVVSEDRITTTSPATTSIRLYNAKAADSFIYAARGGPSRLYNAVFANPGVNKNGDVVFTADNGQLPIKTLGYLAAGTTTPVERSIRSGNPKPMIADNGNVVIQVGGAGGQSNLQILLYPTGLASPFTIADTATNWTSLDNDPGISRDGRIIAFQGNPNALGAAAIGTTIGPGIFVAIDEGTGFGNAKILRLTGGKVEDVAADRASTPPRGNFDGICDPGEICKPGAELGYDSSGNPITIASYPTDSRVGVAIVDFGAGGIDDDSFVVSFVATPSGPSRDNTALPPGTPALFSAQAGLWTIRVDVQHQLAGTARVYKPFTPIPVVQIGDRLGPDIITGLAVYDPIANAAHDESGNIRTMRRGDHRVTFWASTNNGQVIVRGNHLDSDQDGLLDHWETTGIDMDQDGVVDLKLSDFGADIFTRDLFLQVDWVGRPGLDLFKPAGAVFPSDVAGTYSLFEANLRGAEALSGPMYGARIDGSSPIDIRPGIVPHVDAGQALDSLSLPMSLNLGTGTPHGGNYVGMPGNANTLPEVVYFGQPGFTVPGLNVRAFQDVKDTYLGSVDKDARLLAFHYTVFSPFQDFIPNYPAVPYSAVISAGSSLNAIEANQPHSAYPQVAKGQFLVVTSGAAISTARQITSIATDGVTGNVVFNLSAPLSPAPAMGDTVSFLDGSTGLSEVAFAPAPDNNSLPGNDFIVSAGAMGVLQGVPPNQCMEAETASHELGHTLGLRHGGNDQNAFKSGPIYQSVMSYTWQLDCTPVPQLPNYSSAGDKTFDDFANLQFNFSDVQFHVSTSLGLGRGEGYPSDLQFQTPEQTLLDAIAKNGPLDTVPPVVAITSPAASANVAIGSNLVVTVTASDNGLVARVSIAFDTNGNGVSDVGEAVNATKTGANTYQATFSNVSGPSAPRSISAIAWDGWSNSTRTAITVNVGAAALVAVPNVIGLTQSAASTAITGAGLVVGTVTTASSSTVASGNVISSNPAAGASVNTGSSVNLVVSTGPAAVAVPNVVGLTQSAASTAITGAGLVVGAVTSASSSTVASGNVISSNPAAGASVNTGSSVNLVVSTGPAAVAVPNVVGLTQSAASTAITGAGLVVGAVTSASSSTVASGNVISSNPAAGASVNSGSSVNLVISTGPAKVGVPNVVGLSQSAASTAITGAGLVVGAVTTASSSTVASGNVISSNPAAGASVNTGSSVNLVVSTGPAAVAVPNVVGLTQSAASTAITGAGLVVGTVTTASSSTVASGNVISSNPAAGTSVNSGSSVNLVVSTGPAAVAVPNVVGLTQSAASTAITGAGLVVGTVTTASSSTVASGNVISSNPAAGASVNSGSSVNLVVSTGPAAVAVPNVVGLTQSAASTAITGAGLVVGAVTSASSSTVAPGNVISSNPAAGASVNSGSSVNLVVSTGPATVAVPNVVGLTQSAASTAITGVGLAVGTVTTASSSTVAPGNVISSNPAAGASVNTGSSVTLVVSTGPVKVAVPNVVGLTQSSASTAITGAGLVVGTVTTASSSTVASGNVISSNPAAGASVNTGSSVTLVVSTGPAAVAVPNVVGLTQSAASTAITGAGLVVGTVTAASSSTVASGNVISSNPAAGVSVNSGSSVSLVVSKGPAGVAVPNVIGLTQSAASTAINGAGLVIGTVTTASSSTVASGNVISSNPVAGTSVTAGSSVSLVVSAGAVKVAVPNVVGTTQSAALTVITRSGLVIGTVNTAPSSTVASGSVISSSPAAGTSVNSGSSVNLLISSGSSNIPTVVSFSVLFGNRSFNLIGASRNRLPWQITGIQVRFSDDIKIGSAASLGGVTVTGFTGLGTNTLTWSISPVTEGNFNAVLAAHGSNGLKDAEGNSINGGEAFTQAFKVLMGDFNDDGAVTTADVEAINSSANSSNVFADINGDGVVNGADADAARGRIGTVKTK